MKKLIFAAFMLAITITSFAGDGKEPVEFKVNASRSMILEGKVTDSNSGEALTGVKIELPELGLSVYSGFDGEYQIQLPAEGKFKVQYHLITYKPVVVEPIEISTGNGAELNVRLNRQ